MDLTPRSLYIHIPYCLSKCSYCDFFSKPVTSIPDDYVKALCRELDFRLQGKITPETVYIGGGTPSLLSPSQLKLISGSISLKNIKEFTMEMNPDDISEDLLFAARDSGVNRISLGLQSLSDSVLISCNRRAKKSQIQKAVSIIEKKWDGRLSYDLISGLPGESEKSFIEGLQFVCNTKADHISLYSLTIEESTPLGKAVSSGMVDYDFDAADSMWLIGRDFLEANGFNQYEVSNFCKNDSYSMHNLSYWNHLSYIGCGAGAAGTIYKPDGSALRWTNTDNLKEYIKFHGTDFENQSLPEKLNKETEMFEFFMMGLRTIKGISEEKYKDLFGEPFPKKFQKVFNSWLEKDKALIQDHNGQKFYSLGSKGILFLNQFLEELM